MATKLEHGEAPVVEACVRLAQEGQIEALGQGYYRVAAQGLRDTEENA